MNGDQLVMHDRCHDQGMIVGAIHIIDQLIDQIRNIAIFRRDIIDFTAFSIEYRKKHAGRSRPPEPGFFFWSPFFNQCLHLKDQLFGKRFLFSAFLIKKVQCHEIISDFLFRLEEMLMGVFFDRFSDLFLRKRISFNTVGCIGAFSF